jgi:SHS2 domain-containing protein
MSHRYEFVEHTADIAIQAYGDNLTGAFEAAATALFDLLTDGAEAAGEKTISFDITADDQEGLLVRFLSELIYLFEAEQIVLSDFRIEMNSDRKLTATARSEGFDPDRHGNGTLVKGVSYHNLQIAPNTDENPGRIWVLLDV